MNSSNFLIGILVNIFGHCFGIKVSPEYSYSRSTSTKWNEKEAFIALQLKYGFVGGSLTEQSITNMLRDVRSGKLRRRDYFRLKDEQRKAFTMGIDPGHSRISHPINAIKLLSKETANVGSTHLCTEIDFYTFSYGDLGWGCAYRNFQTLWSSLMRDPAYSGILNETMKSFGIRSDDGVPSIPKLQEMLEEAWRQGFDVEGRDQLSGHVTGTKKWIGATEIKTILSSLRIRCELMDIVNEDPSKLFMLAMAYYYKNSKPFRHPLFLQYPGHSTTIVGIEIMKSDHAVLLILDPLTPIEWFDELYNKKTGSKIMSVIRKNDDACIFRKHKYQLISVNGIMDSDKEYEESKIMSSIQF